MIRTAKLRRIVGNCALNVGAILGSLCLVVTIIGLLFGIKPLVFVSGSMSPAITTGSLAFSIPMPVQDISAGDIVSVETSSGPRVTHRVVDNDADGLILKGDANPVSDLQPYPADSVDKLLFSIPLAGYVVTWFGQPWAVFLGGMLCAYVLYIAFGKLGSKDAGSNSHDKSQQSGPGVPRRVSLRRPDKTTALCLALGVAGVLGLSGPSVQPTQAAFIGTATATAERLQTGTMPSIPGTLSCTTVKVVGSLVTRAELTWTAPTSLPSTSRYAVSVTAPDGTTVYADVPKSSRKITFDSSLNLLGSLFEKAKLFNIKVLTVITKDGGAVLQDGSNISWTSAVGSAPTHDVYYSPGVFLASSYECKPK